MAMCHAIDTPQRQPHALPTISKSPRKSKRKADDTDDGEDDDVTVNPIPIVSTSTSRDERIRHAEAITPHREFVLLSTP